ncbi:MAG: DNA helicase RecG [Deltaproteobacteria bacterium]|nr:MAG: DNA helicase RecG [Deltaproteobacteria bacterium]
MQQMDSLERILEALERPLGLASKEGFRHLGKVKGLERLVSELIGRARSFLKDHDLVPLLEELRSTFEGYEEKGGEERKRSVQRALNLIDEIRLRFERRLSPEEALKILHTPIRFVKGVGPRLQRAFERKGILTVEDALYNLPLRYEDRKSFKRISEMRSGEWATGFARVIASEEVTYPRSGRRVFEVILTDGTGLLVAKWFQGIRYVKGRVKKGQKVVFSGEIKGFREQKEVHHPDLEVVEEELESIHFGRIVPIYSLTEGLQQKRVRTIMHNLLQEYLPRLRSFLPREVERRCGLVPFQEALREVHFPSDSRMIGELNQKVSPFHRRLAFEELFFLELGLALRKEGISREKGISFRVEGVPLLEELLSHLPFSLTGAQRRVLEEIKADMARPHPMNRLLQGDVGSGKTVVAFIAALLAIANGYQAALMVPTEILADQHFRRAMEFLGGIGVKVDLLTSKVKGKEREEVYRRIEGGEAELVIGTHALIQESLTFRRLGLAIVDEQHRFGVIQRAKLKRKGRSPDLLVMTATPIPRTLAMTLYGDMEVSVLDEMPPGRQPVSTRLFREGEREEAYRVLAEEVGKGHQAYVVYPLVEESEQLDLADATEGARSLQELFPHWSLGLLHGRMRGEEKEEVMRAFGEGRIQILVATTVIEVGVDVPNATVMLIEHAERFGLSQLHQMRVRIGRGPHPSYCLLLAYGPLSEEAWRRLRVMEETSDGFRIAEEDLALRGPGDILGVRQWGLPDFRVANLARDADLLLQARREALRLIQEDPHLERHPGLKEVLVERWQKRLELAEVG